MNRMEMMDAIASRRAEEVSTESQTVGEIDRQLAIERPSDAEAAADRRLDQATALLQRAEQHLAEANARLRAANEVGREHVEDDLGARLREHAESLYDGRPEEAAQILAEVIAEQQPRIDVKTLTAAVRHELELDGALKTFAENYPEILKDKHLSAKADSFYDTAIKEGKSEAEALIEAGDNTRAHIKKIAVELGMREKGHARARREGTPQEGEPDVRAAIAELAASRPAAMAARYREGRGDSE